MMMMRVRVRDDYDDDGDYGNDDDQQLNQLCH
jgi:hypothetical protein